MLWVFAVFAIQQVSRLPQYFCFKQIPCLPIKRHYTVKEYSSLSEVTTSEKQGKARIKKLVRHNSQFNPDLKQLVFCWISPEISEGRLYLTTGLVSSESVSALLRNMQNIKSRSAKDSSSQFRTVLVLNLYSRNPALICMVQNWFLCLKKLA